MSVAPVINEPTTPNTRPAHWPELPATCAWRTAVVSISPAGPGTAARTVRTIVPCAFALPNAVMSPITPMIACTRRRLIV